MKLLFRLLVLLAAAGGVVSLMTLAGRRATQLPFRAVEVHVLDSARLGLVSANEMKERVLEEVALGSPLAKVDTRRLEKKLTRYPFVRRVEVYKDVRGVLHVEVEQRHPVVKLYSPGGRVMYIDREGLLLPFSPKFPVHMLVASGHLPTKGMRPGVDVTTLPEEHPLHRIYRMASLISDDPFWEAQIEQIYVEADGDYTLTPRVGSHAIYLGKADHLDEQLRKLYIFYTHALNRLGWNQYRSIDLQFKNQIVCTRR